MKVYAVYRNADTNEGRGPMKLVTLFTKKGLADRHIDYRPGVMGRQAKQSEEEYCDWEVMELEVHDSLKGFDYYGEPEKDKKERMHKEAIKKLTKEEKEALGL